MNQYNFPIVCGLWDNGRGLVLMYEFMHESMYISVYVHVCMCVRLANDFINVKWKQNS